MIYDDGMYCYSDEYYFPHKTFPDSYAILQRFPDLTSIEDSDSNTFMMIDNDITHSPYELQLPEYYPAASPDNTNLEPGFRRDSEGNVLDIDESFHYHANMAAFLVLAEWMDYLKYNEVYDNTRIIIVADHGRAAGDNDWFCVGEDGIRVDAYNPLLMVKDFGAKEFSVSDEFMTNADVPTLAVKDLLEDPKNPFTGKDIDNREKTSHDQHILFGSDENCEYTYREYDTTWYGVHDNIFDGDCWSPLPER